MQGGARAHDASHMSPSVHRQPAGRAASAFRRTGALSRSDGARSNTKHRRVPRRASLSLITSTAIWTVGITAAMSAPASGFARSARRAQAPRSHACAPLAPPASAKADAAYLAQVARKRAQLGTATVAVERQRKLLARARNAHSGANAISRASAKLRQRTEEAACLSAELAGTSTSELAGTSTSGKPSSREVTSSPTESASLTQGLPVEQPSTGESPGKLTEPESPSSGLSGSSAPEPPSQAGGHEPEVAAKDTELSIRVQGNHLVNGAGTVVTLHGVGLVTTVWSCLSGRVSESPTDDASIAAIAAWHANAVRIPLNEDCWLGINGAPTDVEAYHEQLKDYVERLQSYGIYVILDLHWNAPGSILSHLGPGFAGWYEMADEDHSPAFWTSVASYFKNDHALLFDLFNEPVGISWSCWLNGCIAPRGYQTAGMQQLVDAVRSTGATQPVMVGGLENAGLDGTEWLAHHPVDPDDQLVASVHVYSQSNVGYFNSNIGVVASHFPVVAGEIGEKNCLDNDLDVFLPWADSDGVSYVAWAWYPAECSSPSLITEYNGTPTTYGAGYREHLLATFPAPSP